MRMHGCRVGEEERKRPGRHMWTVPTRASVAGDGSSFSSSSAISFYKDGRKVNVGDCALFKPPQDSPPFIGIIHSLTSSKENKYYLIVNWLYRRAEVKLGKGIALEAAPNEVFYSFHKDEIPAASLLHPCKVAFLPKGVELPSGICSFVCRRVYDIKNKSLWWLTDKDFINERQEEVDQLLYKTRIEMHGSVQQGGCSPKLVSGPTSASQSKSGCDCVQNSVSCFPSQIKGKKRERGDQDSEPVKREHSAIMDDEDSGQCRSENVLKYEISKITDKGGLVDFDGVEKLVQLMAPERNERKIDLVCRSMFANVIASTDKFDCLNKFVQLRGLPVFDEWLQEVQKGKIGDGKDVGKAIEEFLLVSLRALDKLPVNLQALQMCNIGKSVNHLRSHKNLDIQKKARGLVDTWKKRVQAEMDAKSGSSQAVSWPARQRISEVSQGGNRNSGATSEVAIKSSSVQCSTSKVASAKLLHGETVTKSTSVCASPGSTKSAPPPASGSTNLKDGQLRNASVCGTSDLPSTPGRDDKSSSSSQSHNNSQSCSSDRTKTRGSFEKDDARSSTAFSMTVSNISGGSSRPRKLSNGFSGSALSGIQKDLGSSRDSTSLKHPGSGKLSQSGLTSQKAVDTPMVEGNIHKLIVKIPNRGRSPGQSACPTFLEEPSVMNSRASSPVLLDEHDRFDGSSKEKIDNHRPNVTPDMNNESWQSNDVKDVLTGSDEGDGSPETVPDEEPCRPAEDTGKKAEVSKAASSSSGNGLTSGKSHEVSFSSINALVESCVNHSEAKVSFGDDAGMNLLASVAAGELSKSDVVSSIGSPQRRIPVLEPVGDDNDSRRKLFPGVHSSDSAGEEHRRLGINHTSRDKNADQEKSTGDLTGCITLSSMNLPENGDPCQLNSENSKEIVMVEETTDGAGNIFGEDEAGLRVGANGSSDTKQKCADSLSTADKVSESTPGVECNVDDGSSSHCENNPPLCRTHPEDVKETNDTSAPNEDPSENIDELKVEKVGEVDSRSLINDSKAQKSDWKSSAPMVLDDKAVPSAYDEDRDEHTEKNFKEDEVKEQSCAASAPLAASTAGQMQETGQHAKIGSPKLAADYTERSTHTTIDTSSSASGVPETEAKVEFDLNEGFDGNDGKYGESSSFMSLGCSSAVQQFIPLTISSVSGSVPASITVAAAAKRPFVPPEDLLRSKGSRGWKGSAATSAFRPAEPRKLLEMPLGATGISVPDARPGKLSRPLLDFDLNVPDERVLEDLASQGSGQDTVTELDVHKNLDGSCCEVMGSTSGWGSGGLNLDLNRSEELIDNSNYSTSKWQKTDVPVQTDKLSGSLSNGKVSVQRDFDLNDGPVIDDLSAERSAFYKQPRNVPSHSPFSGLRMSNSAETGNFSSWYPRGNTYSTITVPSVLPDRGEQPFPFAPGLPQRMLAPSTSGSPFSPDVFRGAVLTSSPAAPFPSTPFQYSVFPFGTSFALPSATFSVGPTAYVDSSSAGRLCFPGVNAQFMGPAGAVPSHFPRPYVVSLPDVSNSGTAESSLKWGRKVLDLNAGPGVPDVEGRDETSPFLPRQMSVAGAHVLMEDQARMHEMAGGHKRKEPEGGWDGNKRPSWH